MRSRSAFRTTARRHAAWLATAAVAATAFVAPQPGRPGPVAAAPAGPAVAPASRDQVLGAGWRSSTDRAWTTTGDASGFHVLVADARDGYAWRVAATLTEPGFDTDRWIGNACLTESGRRVVAVYAPRTFTNREQLSARGGFTAVVDLNTGAVTRLPVASSLAYFNPGCGAGEAAALTQEGDEKVAGTRLVRADAATGRVTGPVRLSGQVTSAVPTDGGFTAARGRGLIRVTTAGRITKLADAPTVPFRLTVDGTGGVSYLEKTATGMAARRVSGGRVGLLAQGRVGDFALARGGNGRVFLTGSPTSVSALPANYSRIAAEVRSEVSSEGRMTVQTQLAAADVLPGDSPAPAPGVRLTGRVTGTGKPVAFAVAPETVRLAAAKAALTATTGPAARLGVAAALNEPSDSEGWCSVGRNLPTTMAYAPRPRQVEWAVDYAIFNGLTATRPANFRKFGLPAYAPQGWFPGRTLHAGGHVAAQVMLGILAQESNLWQASQASSGEYGNPLIGNYYGRRYYDSNTSDDWEIHWDEADCGYGIGQVTDGMRKAGREKPGETARQPLHQRAIALDYAANIAAGLQILQDKWNATMADGLIVHNGDPTRLENWFFAIWAYNSGYHAPVGGGQPWGVGWGNNPINPRYDPTRHPFLDVADPNNIHDNVPVFRDAAHPQDWPYQEKVIGWAAASIDTGDDGVGFNAAWWNVDNSIPLGQTEARERSARLRRTAAKPPMALFCDPSNDCDPSAKVQPNEPGLEGEKPGACLHRNSAGQYDLKCWYNRPVSWKHDCSVSCGYESIRYDLPLNYSEPANGTHYPPQCTATGLPAGAVIVDDVPAGTVTPRCSNATAGGGGGSFDLEFSGRAAGEYTSKIDFHQLDSGYGGHHWFARAYYGGALRVVGTWQSPVSWSGRVGVYAYIPPHGAATRTAVYQIRTMDNRIRQANVDQNWHAGTWAYLGDFDTTAGVRVQLDNTRSQANSASVAYDAVAFVRR